MAKCKCGTKGRIVSDVVRSMSNNCCRCKDVCANPSCAEPKYLGLMAPLIYDEIGINLCATFDFDDDISEQYAGATKAVARVINATYTVGANNVQIEPISGRGNCYAVTLTNIGIQFAFELFDDNCNYIGTVSQTVPYLPSLTTTPTYDEDTNPSSVELEIFAPYGLSYSQTTPPTATLGFIGATALSNTVMQGINMFAIGKVLDFDPIGNSATVGLTLVLQSLYFAGYKVKSAGKIDIPKGSIDDPESSECLKFVEGDLLNLAIKPLDIGAPIHEEMDKRDCSEQNESCSGSCKCDCETQEGMQTNAIEDMLSMI